jgi:hypothetical protein
MTTRRTVGVLLVAVLLGSLSAVRPATATVDGPTSGTIDVLSYNVAGLFEPISGDEPSTNSPIISPLLNDYDIVLLQEDWGDPVEELGLVERPEWLPSMHYHHEIVGDAEHPYRTEPAPHPWGTETRRGPVGPTLLADGLNRLSDFEFHGLPIPEGAEPFDNTVDGLVTRVMWRTCFGDLHMTAAEEALDAAGDFTGQGGTLEELGLLGSEGMVDGGSADCGAQKGFSVARTELAPGVEVDIYNLHADAGSHVNDITARSDNFTQLADFIVEHSEGRAVILGGDTNLQITSHAGDRQAREIEIWDEFQERTGLVDVCIPLNCDLEALRDDGIKVHDKFAVRSGGGVELIPLEFAYERERFTRDDGEPLSDHDPLFVRFQWKADDSVESTKRPCAGGVPPVPAAQRGCERTIPE